MQQKPANSIKKQSQVDPFAFIDSPTPPEQKRKKQSPKKSDEAQLLLKEIISRISKLAYQYLNDESAIELDFANTPHSAICDWIHEKVAQLAIIGIRVYDEFGINDIQIMSVAKTLAELFFEFQHGEDNEEILSWWTLESSYSDLIAHTGLPGAHIIDYGRWFRRKVLLREKQVVDYFHLCMQEIGRYGFKYSSDTVVRSRKRQHINHENYAKSHQLFSVDENGNALSFAFPSPAVEYKKKRALVITKTKGIDLFAHSKGYVGYFLTLTLSSEYHPNPKHGKLSWRGITPASGNRKLQKNWELLRKRIHEKGGKMFGVRVMEPHEDGCPHWHLLIYIDPAMELHFIQLVKSIYPAKSAADIVKIDRSDATASTYLMKYVLPYFDEDELEGIHLSNTALKVDAHKSTWGGRSIQFFDLPGSTTIWNELRRVDKESTELEKVSHRAKDLHESAHSGDFFTFLCILQELNFDSVELSILINYEKKANGSKKVAGLIIDGIVLDTHKKSWSLTKKDD